jgi:hypothetical protein
MWTKCSFELENQSICSLIKFETFFSQGLMRKSMEKLGAQDHQWRRERRAPFCFSTNWTVGKEERDIVGEGKRYKYLPTPNSHLSRGSAAAQARQCHSAGVPLSRCDTATPGKTARVRVKCWLSWLSNWGCRWKIEHLVAHFSLMIVSPFIVRFFLYSNSKYKRI